MTVGSEDNFAAHFERIAELAPDRLAVAAGHRAVTWRAFDELADRLASHLTARGVRTGDRIALDARNSPEYLIALHAVFKIAAVPVNVNYRYRAEEVRHILGSARVTGMIADAARADVDREAARPLPGCDVLATIDPEGGFGPEVAAAPRTHRDRRREETEWLLFTGGTTGYPKAVIGRHSERLRGLRSGALTRSGLDPADPEALGRVLAVDPHGPEGRVLLVAPPLMHATGLYAALGALCGGVPVVLTAGGAASGPDIVAAISAYRVTAMVIVGDAFALRLLDVLDDAAAAGRPLGIGSLREIRSVGAIWSPAVKSRLLEHADLTLFDGIASTEGGPYALSSISRDTAADGGRFVRAPRARLLDEDGNDVRPGSGTVGLLAAPITVGAAYEGEPDKSAETFRDVDGVRYAIPGDMATLEADGTLTLLGRSSSVINTGGEKVYADEVELALRRHPAVRDAVVVGVPDPQWGSCVGAVIALERGTHADPDELTAFVGARLAGYKKPRRVAIVPEIQRLNTGKTDLAWAASQLGA